MKTGPGYVAIGDTAGHIKILNTGDPDLVSKLVAKDPSLQVGQQSALYAPFSEWHLFNRSCIGRHTAMLCQLSISFQQMTRRLCCSLAAKTRVSASGQSKADWLVDSGEIHGASSIRIHGEIRKANVENSQPVISTTSS